MKNKQYILGFDTSLSACSVAVYDSSSDKVVYEYFELRSRGHAEVLAPLINEAILEIGISFADLSDVIVTVGPGTFTGIRTSLAMAKGISIAANVKVIGIGTLQAIALGIYKADLDLIEKNIPIVVAIDARRNEVYLQVFNYNAEPINSPNIVNIADVANIIKFKQFYLVGSGSELVRSQFDNLDIRTFDNIFSDPNATSFINMRNINSLFYGNIEPLYIRKPDAKKSKGL